MRSSRRTTGQVAENSVVDDATDSCTLRLIFATFLADSSTSLGRPYFYLIQSNGWKSLCLLTGLSVPQQIKSLQATEPSRRGRRRQRYCWGVRVVAGVGRRTWCCRGRRAAASGFKREVTINMLLGGACGKARGWKGHGVRHGRRWKQRPSR